MLSQLMAFLDSNVILINLGVGKKVIKEMRTFKKS